MHVPLIEHHKATLMEPHMRIDLIGILDRGVYLNFNAEGKLGALPTPGSVMGFVASKEDTLFLFYALLSHLMNQAEMPKFRFIDYIGQVQLNKADSTV